MNFIDILIIGGLFLGAFVGVRNGFIRQTVITIGFIFISIIAFQFKGILSAFFYDHLPFFNFFGDIKGIQIFNILLYELIAFLVLVALLLFIFKLLLMVSNIIETFLSLTFLLKIPSKIFGAIVGAFYFFLLIFIGLYIYSLPFFNNETMLESRFAKPILTETPILSLYTEDAYQMFDQFVLLKEQYVADEDATKFNLEALDVMLKYNLVDVETIEGLVRKEKLEIDGIERVLEKYR